MAALRQERNGRNQKRIVGQAREKLSAHDGIKTAIHNSSAKSKRNDSSRDTLTRT